MNYWWIIARNWDWINNQEVGALERWDALTENIHPRIRANFRRVKSGDKVIGYNAGNDRSVVAVGYISRALYEDGYGAPSIDIKKTNNLIEPITIEKIRNISQFYNFKFRNQALNTTIIPLDENEYYLILALGNNIFSDLGDNFENIIDVLNADDSVTKVEPKLCPEQSSSTSTTYPRNPSYAKEALRNTGYRCELEDVENRHTTFKSQITGKNFVEAHHLVPMKAQDKYKPINLDIPGNIIALCPNCHKLLHLGVSEDRISKVTELYTKRKDILKQWGISITLDDLIEIYR